MIEKFRLRIDVNIEKTDEHGYNSGERLSVREQFEIRPADFMEIAGVLGRFHDLARKIEREQEEDARLSHS